MTHLSSMQAQMQSQPLPGWQVQCPGCGVAARGRDMVGASCRGVTASATPQGNKNTLLLKSTSNLKASTSHPLQPSDALPASSRRALLGRAVTLTAVTSTAVTTTAVRAKSELGSAGPSSDFAHVPTATSARRGGGPVLVRAAAGAGAGSGESSGVGKEVGAGEEAGEEIQLAGPGGVKSTGNHKRPPQIFYSRKVRPCAPFAQGPIRSSGPMKLANCAPFEGRSVFVPGRSVDGD